MTDHKARELSRDLAERLDSILGCALADRGFADPRWSIEPPPLSWPWHSKRGQQRFAIQCWDEGSEQRARLFAIQKKHQDASGPEYGTLREVRNAFDANKAFGVPDPIAWMPEDRVLITEYAEGLPMADMLSVGALRAVWRWRRRSVDRQVRRVARWLHFFQTRGLGWVTPGTTAPIAGSTQEALGFLQHEWPKVARNLRRYIDLADVERITLPAVNHHGDFLFRNIILGSRCVVVDWEGRWKLADVHPYYELYRFMTNLEALARYRLYSPAALESLASSLMTEFCQISSWQPTADELNLLYRSYLAEMLWQYATQRRGMALRRSYRTTRFLEQFMGMASKRGVPEVRL